MNFPKLCGREHLVPLFLLWDSFQVCTEYLFLIVFQLILPAY